MKLPNKNEREAVSQEGAEEAEVFDATEFAVALDSEPRLEQRPVVSEIEFSLLTPERKAKAIELEHQYLEKADAAQEEGAKERGKLVSAAIKAAEILDLDTKEKVISAALELLPAIGFAYALAGRRIEVVKVEDVDQEGNEVSRHEINIEKIGMLDRVIYLMGELMYSGHAARGVIMAIKKKGVGVFAKTAGEQLAARAGRMLIKRAKEGVKRELKEGINRQLATE